MPSTYTVNLGIEKPATGEQSGTWGDTTNVNFDILDQAINGAERVTLSSAGSSGSPNALIITNGAASDGRNKWIEFYSSGDLGGDVFVQLQPNDAEKIVFVRNSLAGSQSVLLFQGTYNSGRDLEIPAGVDMVVKFDGGGASAANVTDVYNNLKVTGLVAGTADINGGTVDGTVIGGASAAALTATTVVANTSLNIAGDGATVTGIKDEDDMASNSATKLATQQSIKAYVDSQVGTVDTLSEILANGNTTGANDIDVDAAQKVQFRDAAIYINSSVDGQLDIVADTEIQIAATTVDVNGTLAFDSLKGTGATTVTNILDEDNMASDSATAIATQQSIKAYVDSQVGSFDTLAEVLAQGNTTGGTDLAVSTGDDVTFADSSKAIFGAGSDLEIYHDGSHSYIKDGGTGDLRIWADSPNIATASGNKIFFGNSGYAELYAAGGAIRLAATASGIDVTGSVTATTATGSASPTPTKITIATSTSASDWSTTAPWGRLAFYSADTSAGGAKEEVTLNVVAAQAAGGVSDFTINTYNSGAKERLRISYDGNLSLYEDTGTTPKLAWSAANERLTLTGSDYQFGIQQGANQPWYTRAVSDGTFRLHLNGTGDVLTADTSGNVGIGTSSPRTLLHVTGLTGDDDPALGSSAAPVFISNTANSYGLNIGVNNAGAGWLQAQSNTASTAYNLLLNPLGGNVGIGTSSPANKLHVAGGKLQITGATGGGAGGGYLSGETATEFHIVSEDYTGAGYADIVFDSGNGSGSSYLERMRIDSSGNLLVGTTSQGYGLFTSSRVTLGDADSGDGFCVGGLNQNFSAYTVEANDDTGTRYFAYIANGSSAAVGTISFTSTATSYNTSSDQRLKENIEDADDAGSKIDAIQVRKFDWKVDGSHQDYGMVAQELQVVAPEAVSAPEDPEEMMGVDYSKLVPMMLKEIQSLRARINALEAE
jgi:hypothetical protein